MPGGVGVCASYAERVRAAGIVPFRASSNRRISQWSGLCPQAACGRDLALPARPGRAGPLLCERVCGAKGKRLLLGQGGKFFAVDGHKIPGTRRAEMTKCPPARKRSQIPRICRDGARRQERIWINAGRKRPWKSLFRLNFCTSARRPERAVGVCIRRTA